MGRRRWVDVEVVPQGRTSCQVRGAAIAAFAFALTVGCSAHKAAHADAPLVCPKTDGLAEGAVAAAEATYPGPLDADKIIKRRTYINENLVRLFDPHRTGYLDLERYEDWQWAGLLVGLPPGECGMNFQQYRLFMEGSYESIKQADKYRPFVARVDAITFAQLSSDGKYITRQDLARQWFDPSFHNFDTEGNGRALFSGNLSAYTQKEKD